MYWKGYSGDNSGVGGALGLEGAMRLHWVQLVLTTVISGVIPGQNTDASALEFMEVTP